MTAAIAAANNGVDVLLIEKMAQLGGANVGWALTSGYLAGNAISAALGK